MNRMMTTAELEALPVGTQFRVASADGGEVSDWESIGCGKAIVVDGEETEDVEWFATDSSSWAHGEGRIGWPWTIEVLVNE